MNMDQRRTKREYMSVHLGPPDRTRTEHTMTPTPEQRATLAQTRARLDQLATFKAGDRAHVAARQAERRAHKAAMRERKQDRRALEVSTGPVWFVPTDPVPARSTRPVRPIHFTPTGR